MRQVASDRAADYFAKPWNDDELLASVRNLLRVSELTQENARLRSHGARARLELARDHDLCGLVYESDVGAARLRLTRQRARAAESLAAREPGV